MRYVQMVGSALGSLFKVGYVYIESLFTKRFAIRQFKQELFQLGLPHDVVETLTAEYAEMLSLNPFYYVKLGYDLNVKAPLAKHMTTK